MVEELCTKCIDLQDFAFIIRQEIAGRTQVRPDGTGSKRQSICERVVGMGLITSEAAEIALSIED